MHRCKAALATFLLVLASITLPHKATAADPKVLDPVVAARIQAVVNDLSGKMARGMADFDVPGAAVGIVAGDRLIYQKGFGERSKGSGQVVNSNTIFQIGSNAKAFLTATMAIMVDRGKLAWDDRVTDRYPLFLLKDPAHTREFRLFDLVSQRSGLPMLVNDMMAMWGFDGAAMIAALRIVEPAGEFRQTFSYTNVTHLVASRIVAQAAGAPDWNAVVHKELLGPLGMRESSTTVEGIEGAANHAHGHRWLPGGTIEVPFTPIFPYHLAGAGGLNSNVEDMSRWVRLQLAGGQFEGARLISAENLAVTWQPKVRVSETMSYAMGWYELKTENGNIIWHDGDALSFGSFVGMAPGQNVGVIILTNETNQGFPLGLGAWMLNRIMGNPEVDALPEQLAHARDGFAAATARFARPANARPSPPLASLTGRFANPGFGDAVVTQDRDALVMQIAATGAQLRLVPWDGDTFTGQLVASGQFGPIVNLGYMTKAFVSFPAGAGGGRDVLLSFPDNGQTFLFLPR